ncbi:hypothetical protein [Proteus mirabilis]|uniref:hypothetical protein n=1 Tax=Proteus mirabilis TaxID=584 RepID=UPI0034D689C5
MYLNRNQYESPLIVFNQLQFHNIDPKFENWCLLQLQDLLKRILAELGAFNLYDYHYDNIMSTRNCYYPNMIVSQCDVSLPGGIFGIKGISIPGERLFMENGEIYFEVIGDNTTLYIDFPKAVYDTVLSEIPSILRLNDENLINSNHRSKGIRLVWNVYDSKYNIRLLREFLEMYVWYFMYTQPVNRRSNMVTVSEIELGWDFNKNAGNENNPMSIDKSLQIKKVRDMFRSLDIIKRMIV